MKIHKLIGVAVALLPLMLGGCSGLEAYLRPEPGAGGADSDASAPPTSSADVDNEADEDGTIVNVGAHGGPVIVATGNGVILIGTEPSEDLLTAARRAPPDPEPEPEPESELQPDPEPAPELEPEPDPAAALDVLRESLLEWEDLRLEPYELFGTWHVCVGHRTGGPGADDHRAHTREECLELLEADMAEGITNAERVLGPDTWAALSAGRRAVLAELAVIVGAEGLAGFDDMLEAVRAGDFERAGDEIILSLLPRQDQIGPDRTRDLASRMRAG